MADPKIQVSKEFDDWLGRMSTKLGGGGTGAQGGECRTDDAVQHAVSDKDWTTLAALFSAAVQRWCGSMQHVVNQFEKDVGQKKADSSQISLAVTVVKGVVGECLPSQAKIALAVAKPVMDHVVKQLQTGRISLRDFCSAWDKGFHDFKAAESTHKKMFVTFKKDVVAKCGAGLSLEAVSNEISYLAKHLPQPDAVRKALLKAWIDSTEDEGWFIDEWSDVAGYFKVTIWREAGDRWTLKEAYLDDTDEQDGVIGMLQKEYPNTPLEKLPFPMRVYIHHGMNYKHFTFVEKGKSGGWALKKGMQEVFDDWRKSGKANPTTKDLTKEPVL